MIQTKWERERKNITKRNTNRLTEWKTKKRIRVRVRDKMKTLEERKKEKQKFIRNMYMEEIQNYKNEEIKKNTKIYEKLVRGTSSYSEVK